MKFKSKTIYAKDLTPGSLVYSYRTNQLMTIISVSHDKDELNQRVKIKWIPMIESRHLFEVDVNFYSVFNALI
jgi:hypothetical protein